MSPRPSRIRLILEYEYDGETYHSVTDDVTRNGPDVLCFNRELKQKIVECIGAQGEHEVKGDGRNWPQQPRLGKPARGPYQRPEQAAAPQTRSLGGDPPGDLCWHDPTCEWFCID